MIAQRGFSGPKPWVKYDALEKCLRMVAAEAKQIGAIIAMPRIGCGIAGGNWTEVEPLILQECDGVQVNVYDWEPE
jgi:O-acetyl-ADP-ribose deacetylase (regulator of RNase III)